MREENLIFVNNYII